jgi:hypothetical protein
MKAIAIGLQGATPNPEDERPGIAERYTSAATSSHLKVEAERCDVDYLMAAASMRDSLGPVLFRLRAEYDAARAVIPQGGTAVEDHLSALDALKNFEPAWTGVGQLSREINARDAFEVEDVVALKVAARVLDAWLDPNCRTCEGRGFNGGRHRGERVLRCGGCQGTGTRRTLLGDTAPEKRLARLVFDSVLGLLHNTTEEMGRRLRRELTT